MSRVVPFVVAIIAITVSIALLAVEREVKPAWTEARKQPLTLLWTARWADMFAQLLLLVVVIVAISHLLSEVRERWRSSTPTQ